MVHLVPGFPRGLSVPSSFDWVSPFAWPYHCPREEKPPFPDKRGDALSFCFLEGLDISEDGVVGPTLETKDLPEDSEVCFSERDIMLHVEGSRHTPVQHGLNHLCLQHANLQAESGGRRDM